MSAVRQVYERGPYTSMCMLCFAAGHNQATVELKISCNIKFLQKIKYAFVCMFQLIIVVTDNNSHLFPTVCSDGVII